MPYVNGKVPSANPYTFKPQAGEADPYAASRPELDEQQRLLEESQRWPDIWRKAATYAVLGLGGGNIAAGLMGGGGAGAGAASESAATGSLPAVEGGAPWAVTPYAANSATMAAPGAAGAGAAAGGAGAGAGAAGFMGMNPAQIASLGLAGAGTIGGALSGNSGSMNPNTSTTDPNLQKLIATMQGRLDASDPLYKSIMAMANGLLPTQYQNGGAGR